MVVDGSVFAVYHVIDTKIEAMHENLARLLIGSLSAKSKLMDLGNQVRPDPLGAISSGPGFVPCTNENAMESRIVERVVNLI
jgi:hypothetical protein